ncbi:MULTISPECIES: phage holin [Bacillaceae]|uniref:Holin n=1 Tax=Alkalicoccobacillus plakortidis TaxID=444060 RepID=A0A9D5DNA7_9BACI|nr:MULTISPECIES: phage holin [Bacillaceae]KQL57248.1 holin [Alkalicoccobacillus plakortidis]
MDKGTKVRTTVLFLALINQFLVSAGLNPVPGSEELWGEMIAWGITAAVAVWTWFRNNYVTWRGKRQKQELVKAGLAKGDK